MSISRGMKSMPLFVENQLVRGYNMEIAVIAARQVVELFIIIFAGGMIYRMGLINKEGTKALSNILIYLIVSCMALSTYMVEYDPQKSANLFRAFGYSTMLMLIGFAISFLVTWKMKADNKRVVQIACMFSNAGYMGFPLIKAMFGSEGLLYTSAFLTVFNIFVWTVGIITISGETNVKDAAVTVVKTPCIIAVAIGLVIYFGRIPVPDVIKDPVTLIGDMNTPVSMLVIGITIASSDLRKLIRNSMLLVIIGVRMFLVPAVCLLVMKLLNINDMVAMVALVLEACPSAAITTVFAIKYNNDEELAAGAVVFTTLLSIITLPVYTYLITAL